MKNTIAGGGVLFFLLRAWTSLWGSDPVPTGQPNRDLIMQVGNLVEETGTLPFGGDNNGDTGECSADDPLLRLAADSNVPIDFDEDTFIV